MLKTCVLVFWGAIETRLRQANAIYEICILAVQSVVTLKRAKEALVAAQGHRK